jgi:hypothetical protein
MVRDGGAGSRFFDCGVGPSPKAKKTRAALFCHEFQQRALSTPLFFFTAEPQSTERSTEYGWQVLSGLWVDAPPESSFFTTKEERPVPLVVSLEISAVMGVSRAYAGLIARREYGIHKSVVRSMECGVQLLQYSPIIWGNIQNGRRKADNGGERCDGDGQAGDD